MSTLLLAALVLLVAACQMLFFNLKVGPSVKKAISFWFFWMCFLGALALIVFVVIGEIN